MAIYVTIRWAGPSDATVDSTYKIEHTLDNSAWSTLAATQAATSPYVSVSSTLNGNFAYGVATVTVVNGTSFSNAGYGWLDDALIQWTGKSTHDLTGVTWHSGYGTYATGSTLYEAHEDYTDSGITPSLKAVLYRITHTNAAGNDSAPTYLWYFYPPLPESSDHCVVIAALATDLGVAVQSSINITANMADDTQFSDYAGLQLDMSAAAGRTAATNAFGLAFFQCWKSARRGSLAGVDAAYSFVLAGAGGIDLTITAATIPDRDWVLLKDIATS
jgi:hypothetical protein